MLKIPWVLDKNWSVSDGMGRGVRTATTKWSTMLKGWKAILMLALRKLVYVPPNEQKVVELLRENICFLYYF